MAAHSASHTHAECINKVGACFRVRFQGVFVEPMVTLGQDGEQEVKAGGGGLDSTASTSFIMSGPWHFATVAMHNTASKTVCDISVQSKTE